MSSQGGSSASTLLAILSNLGFHRCHFGCLVWGLKLEYQQSHIWSDHLESQKNNFWRLKSSWSPKWFCLRTSWPAIESVRVCFFLVSPSKIHFLQNPILDTWHSTAPGPRKGGLKKVNAPSEKLYSCPIVRFLFFVWGILRLRFYVQLVEMQLVMGGAGGDGLSWSREHCILYHRSDRPGLRLFLIFCCSWGDQFTNLYVIMYYIVLYIILFFQSISDTSMNHQIRRFFDQQTHIFSFSVASSRQGCHCKGASCQGARPMGQMKNQCRWKHHGFLGTALGAFVIKSWNQRIDTI